MRRRRRGAAVLVTVLLLVVAASIAYSVARVQALNATESATRNATGAALRSAESALTSVDARLAADPTGFLSHVWPEERARVCEAAGGTTTTVQPGQNWDCGSSWTYTDADDDPTPNIAQATVDLTPPASTDGTSAASLKVRATGRLGNIEAVVEVTYEMDGARRWSWASTGDVDLNSPAALTFNGGVYAAGNVTVPTSGVTLAASAPVATSTGFTGTPGAGVWYGPTPTTGPPAIRSILEVAPQRLTPAALATAAGAARTVACPTGTPYNLTSGPSAGRVTSLCLTAGGVATRADGTPAAVPSNTAAYMIAFTRGTDDRVEIFAATTAPDLTSSSPLLCSDPDIAPIDCSLPDHAAAGLAAGTHPGSPAWWSTGANVSLGVFNLPASGIIATDADTYIGACGTGYATGGNCDTLASAGDGNQPGTTVKRPVTVVAGTVATPADIVVGAPIHTSGNGALGLVASDRAVVAYWAHPRNVDFTVDATLLGAGIARGDGTASVTAWPRNLAGAGTQPENWTANATVAAAHGQNLDRSIDGVSTLAWRSVARPAPWFAGTTFRWARSATTRLS